MLGWGCGRGAGRGCGRGLSLRSFPLLRHRPGGWWLRLHAGGDGVVGAVSEARAFSAVKPVSFRPRPRMPRATELVKYQYVKQSRLLDFEQPTLLNSLNYNNFPITPTASLQTKRHAFFAGHLTH